MRLSLSILPVSYSSRSLSISSSTCATSSPWSLRLKYSSMVNWVRMVFLKPGGWGRRRGSVAISSMMYYTREICCWYLSLYRQRRFPSTNYFLSEEAAPSFGEPDESDDPLGERSPSSLSVFASLQMCTSSNLRSLTYSISQSRLSSKTVHFLAVKRARMLNLRGTTSQDRVVWKRAFRSKSFEWRDLQRGSASSRTRIYPRSLGNIFGTKSLLFTTSIKLASLIVISRLPSMNMTCFKFQQFWKTSSSPQNRMGEGTSLKPSLAVLLRTFTGLRMTIIIWTVSLSKGRQQNLEMLSNLSSSWNVSKEDSLSLSREGDLFQNWTSRESQSGTSELNCFFLREPRNSLTKELLMVSFEYPCLEKKFGKIGTYWVSLRSPSISQLSVPIENLDTLSNTQFLKSTLPPASWLTLMDFLVTISSLFWLRIFTKCQPSSLAFWTCDLGLVKFFIQLRSLFMKSSGFAIWLTEPPLSATIVALAGPRGQGNDAACIQYYKTTHSYSHHKGFWGFGGKSCMICYLPMLLTILKKLLKIDVNYQRKMQHLQPNKSPFSKVAIKLMKRFSLIAQLRSSRLP
ncbi:hypothetical protein FGO68_gene1736 [Halteria grandinella]|uniref:Uncharacterized protein n=1 Tax=Halteria grandinella TaxID=5974 RepID=A0A8J8SXV9_HALGN|nr:hypothetical protein FGO68_gene1736 [Halteria grandinella]